MHLFANTNLVQNKYCISGLLKKWQTGFGCRVAFLPSSSLPLLLPPICHFFARHFPICISLSTLQSYFFCGFWTDLLSIQEEMFYNSFLTSTISPSVRISIKNGVFCIFHIIFTGFSLSWTRRVLRQARIRDVKYYTNCELATVIE